MSPKETAINLIKVYVERGESIKDLKSGMMGSYSSDSHAQISGWVKDKRYSTDYIIVERSDGKDCLEVFKLKNIYEEIKNPNKQMALL